MDLSSNMCIVLILFFAPLPAWLGNIKSQNDFSGKSSGQEAGIFVSSAIATSAIGKFKAQGLFTDFV